MIRLVEKNLFLYDLAVVAIFKDEGRYLKEWLDYHLLAGVKHFYLYNNDSTDNYAEVLAPYVEKKLVTLINFPGKAMQIPAYIDALQRFRFFCRYMAFIDLDEFIFPKTNRSIVEVTDEILSHDSKAQALAVSWHMFGSNNLETADYSRGVLERFTRRAPDKWETFFESEKNVSRAGNMYVKLIANPRSVKMLLGSHVGIHFGENYSVNERGEKIVSYANESMCTDKITLNHYSIKSREEFFNKTRRGIADKLEDELYTKILFDVSDRNEVFDDGILKYRAARAENFFIESDNERLRRVEKILIDILTECSPFDAPEKFFVGKLETFLTCRAVAEKFGIKIGEHFAEEYALVWIYQCFMKKTLFTYAELQLFLSELPALLAREFPLCKKLNRIAQEKIFPLIYSDLKAAQEWFGFYDFQYIQRLLQII